MALTRTPRSRWIDEGLRALAAAARTPPGSRYWRGPLGVTNSDALTTGEWITCARCQEALLAHADGLALALLVVLDTLTPAERTVDRSLSQP